MTMKKLKFEPVRFDGRALILIDQRKLPGKLTELRITSVRGAWRAIRDMIVRGAPAIGAAAGYGVCLDVMRAKPKDRRQFLKLLRASSNFLKTARPTAVNLAWAIERVWRAVSSLKTESAAELRACMIREAKRIHAEDVAICFAIGAHGVSLIRPNARVLTYCNAGGLATTGYGTALSPMFEAKRLGRHFHVYSCETRPRLQGARLTMWELQQYRVPSTLICDSMVGTLMRQGKISLVITGADRIVANGDTANKIGTYSVACLAKLHGVPFYAAAPSSTFDFSKKTGSQIPIEERETEEVTHWDGKRHTPSGIAAYNPAFDVTPHALIAGFITEKGILRPPYARTLWCLK